SGVRDARGATRLLQIRERDLPPLRAREVGVGVGRFSLDVDRVDAGRHAVEARRVRDDAAGAERPRLVGADRARHVVGAAHAEEHALWREARFDEVEIGRLAAGTRADERARAAGHRAAYAGRALEPGDVLLLAREAARSE